MSKITIRKTILPLVAVAVGTFIAFISVLRMMPEYQNILDDFSFGFSAIQTAISGCILMALGLGFFSFFISQSNKSEDKEAPSTQDLPPEDIKAYSTILAQTLLSDRFWDAVEIADQNGHKDVAHWIRTIATEVAKGKESNPEIIFECVRQIDTLGYHEIATYLKNKTLNRTYSMSENLNDTQPSAYSANAKEENMD